MSGAPLRPDGVPYSSAGLIWQVHGISAVAALLGADKAFAERIAAGKTGMKAGAGFMEWPADKAAAERAAYEKRLKASFDVLNMQS